MMDALKKLKLPLLDFQCIRIVDDRLVIMYVGNDRMSDRKASIKYVEKLSDTWAKLTDKEQLSFVRLCVVKAMTHELDEYIYISGLGEDPHKNTF